MELWVALAGWPAAVVALSATVRSRRALAGRLVAVAEACHELRAPLAAIALGLELTGRQGSLPPARLRAIELELERAALVLEDLQAGPRRCEPGPRRGVVDVGELLADSVEAWRPAAERRGGEVLLEPPAARAVVRGDRPRLAQAIGNLLANAIEHGGGRVRVAGHVGGGRIRIEVQDRGPGLMMPVARLVRRSRHARPHGHGLRIAQAIAAAHGGRIASAPAEAGARVVLELPAAAGGGAGQGGPR